MATSTGTGVAGVEARSVEARSVEARTTAGRVRGVETGGVDLLAGANADEMNLYVVPSGVGDALTEERALAGLAALLGRAGGPRAGELLAAGEGSPGERYAAVLTDRVFRDPARRLVAAHHGRGYRYEFARRSPSFGGRLGAWHALDLPFVFGTLPAASGPGALAGEDPPAALAAEMVAAWTAFAASGDPGWAPDDGDEPHRFG